MANRRKPVVTPKGFVHMLDMNELAQWVGRHPQVLRKYYAAELLPEPKHSIKHRTKTTRLFTVEEADKIKVIFDNMEWGTLTQAKRRTKLRKARRKK